MSEDIKPQIQSMEVKEQMLPGYVPVSDFFLEEAVFLSKQEELGRLDLYVKQSFLEQFGVSVETEFVKDSSGFRLGLGQKSYRKG